MLLLDLITHIIIEDTNRKECVVARAKMLFVKTNMIEDKPTPKRYEKNLTIKRKIIINFLISMELTLPSRRREIVLSTEDHIIMHLSANMRSKSTILLRQI